MFMSPRLKPINHNSNIPHERAYQNIQIKNQPEKSLYTPVPRHLHWFESGDPLKICSTIAAYITFGQRFGFGLGEKAVNLNTIHWSIDRASPLFWF